MDALNNNGSCPKCLELEDALHSERLFKCLIMCMQILFIARERWLYYVGNVQPSTFLSNKLVLKLLTSIGILSDVAVAMAIPYINTKILGSIVVEWSKALVPATVDGAGNWYVGLLSVTSVVALTCLTVSTGWGPIALWLILLLLLITSILSLLKYNLLVIVGLWWRICALVAVLGCEIHADQTEEYSRWYWPFW